MSIIKTERLLLRPLTDNDATEMFKNWTNSSARYTLKRYALA